VSLKQTNTGPKRLEGKRAGGGGAPRSSGKRKAPLFHRFGAVDIRNFPNHYPYGNFAERGKNSRSNGRQKEKKKGNHRRDARRELMGITVDGPCNLSHLPIKTGRGGNDSKKEKSNYVEVGGGRTVPAKSYIVKSTV